MKPIGRDGQGRFIFHDGNRAWVPIDGGTRKENEPASGGVKPERIEKFKGHDAAVVKVRSGILDGKAYGGAAGAMDADSRGIVLEQASQLFIREPKGMIG
jgi:hypothetical protein